MKIVSKMIILINILLIYSCANKETSTKDFIEKISLESWKSKTFEFIKNECSIDKYKYYNRENREGYIVLSANDTIFSVDDHIKHYAKYRVNFLSKLKEKINFLPKKTTTMVITEEYTNVDEPEISYTVYSDTMDKGLRFYFKSNEFEEIQELEKGFKEYGYDFIVKSKSKCTINYTGYLNKVTFDTVISLTGDNKIEYTIKDSFFGHLIID
ncbi:hypothetical protein V2701_03095 [Tenacibaculum maritimum]